MPLDVAISELLKKGNVSFSNGNFEEARIIFTQLRERLQSDLRGTKQSLDLQYLLIEVNCKIARVLCKQGNLDEPTSMLEEMLNQSRDLKYLNGEFLALAYLSSVYEIRGEYSKAMELNEKNLELSIANNLPMNQALIHLNIGRIHWRQGLYSEAVTYTNRALETYKKLKNPEGEADAYNSLANVFFRQGKHLISKKYYESAMEIYQQIGKRHGVAGVLNNLAIIKKFEGKLEESLRLHEQSMKIREELGDSLGMALSLRNIANLQTERGEFDEALTNYNRALDIRLKAEDQHGTATVLGSIAELYFSMGKLEKAVKHYHKSLEIYKAIGLEDNLVEHLCKYSELLVNQGNHKQVQELLDEARQLVEKHNSETEQSLYLLHSAIFEKSRENLGKAREYFLAANKLARKHNYHDVILRSSIFLAESNLQKFKITFNYEHYHLATTYIEEALSISRKETLIPVLINTLIIKSALLSVNLNFSEALKVLNEARELCKQGLVLLSKRVEAQIKQIEDRMLMYRKTYEEQKQQYQDINTNDALNFLDLLNRAKNSTGLKVANLFMTVFKHDARGPVVLVTDELPFKERNPQILESMGFFFSLAIGQGHRHHEGLFGALPLANETNFSAIVYSVALKDKEQKDPRMKGTNFILFCLIYQNDLGHYFYDRFELESIFREHVLTINDISAINEESLKRLKEMIVEKMSHI